MNKEKSIKIFDDWFIDWAGYSKRNSKNYSLRFLDSQMTFFDELVNEISLHCRTESLVYSYIFDGISKEHLRIKSDSKDDAHYKEWYDNDYMTQLQDLFYLKYFQDTLDKEDFEKLSLFIAPSKEEYHFFYDLKLNNKILKRNNRIFSTGLDKNGWFYLPEILVLEDTDIDRFIILQLEQYEGGEKIEFLEHQYQKIKNKTKRSLSLKGYLESLKKSKLISKDSYLIASEFLNQKIEKNTNLDNPIRTKLNLKQIGIFYRMLADSDFTDDTKTRIFNILSLSHTSKDGRFPTFDYLEKQTSKASPIDKARLGKILTDMKNNLEKMKSK